MSNLGTVILVVGPAGSGKNTLLKHACGVFPELGQPVSVTTRPPRPGEVHGRDYFFFDDAVFDQMIAEEKFAEWALVHGVKRYGVPIEELRKFILRNQNAILDINIDGAKSLRSHSDSLISKNVYTIFVGVSSPDDLRGRMIHRGGMEMEEIERRMASVPAEEAYASQCDTVIYNDDLERAKAAFVHIIQQQVLS